MRKLILSALLVASTYSLFAQKLNDVQEKISKGKFDEAKEKIDEIANNPKYQDNSNVWYNKAVIYTNLSLDSTKSTADAAKLRGEAYSALRKYYELDPKNVMGALEQNVRLWQLYEGYYTSAVKDYNNNDFSGSFNNFKSALEVGEYINKKGFDYNGTTLPALDTNLILNVAATASKAKLEDSAMNYYRKLADARLTDEKFVEIYQILADYYNKKNDQTNYTKYLSLGKEMFPGDYWYDVELSPLREDKPKLLDKYASLSAANPTSYYLNYNYAVELFNYLYANDDKPADAAKYQPLIENAINAAIKTDTTQNANLLMVRYHMANINSLEDSMQTITGKTAADVQKKKAITTQVSTHYTKVLPYAEKVFNNFLSMNDLKGSDKGNLRFVGNILIDYYDRNNKQEKANQIEAQMKAKG